MKPFFKPEDFKGIEPTNTYGDLARIANAKLSANGVVVYGMEKEEWSVTETSHDIFTALLINIQPIEEEKPKCCQNAEAYNHWKRIAIARKEATADELDNYCRICGQKLGGA